MKFHPPKKIFVYVYRKVLFRFAGDVLMLLTTTGRKTGKEHTIGLQYELIEGHYYIGAADGTRADWYRNILKRPQVKIQVGASHLTAVAEAVCEQEKIAEFLAYRLKKRPLMIGLILRLDGVKGTLNRAALEKYSSKVGLVILTPSTK